MDDVRDINDRGNRRVDQPEQSIELIVRRNADRLATPCYVFDPATVIDRYQALRQALHGPLIASLGANPNRDLFARCFHAFVDGVEVASQSELNVVVGRSAAPRYVYNVALDTALLRAALAARASVVVDNHHQAEMLVAYVGRAAPLPVGLRLNSTALDGWVGGDHFGMDLSEALAAIDRLKGAGIRIGGCWIAGEPGAGMAARSITALTRVAAVVENKLGYRLSMLTLGDRVPDPWTASAVADYARELSTLGGDFVIAHQCGRSIYASAGAFVTRVVATKIIGGRQVVICDGGMPHNFLLCQTERPIREHASPRLVAAGDAPRARAGLPLQLVGPTSNENDIIGRLPPDTAVPLPGDLVVFANCGAYNMTYTVSEFLGSKHAVVYVNS